MISWPMLSYLVAAGRRAADDWRQLQVAEQQPQLDLTAGDSNPGGGGGAGSGSCFPCSKFSRTALEGNPSRKALHSSGGATF